MARKGLYLGGSALLPRLAQAWAERAGAIGHARTWPRTALRFQALFNDMVGTVHGT